MSTEWRFALLALAALANLSGCGDWHTSTGAATADPAARGTWRAGTYDVILDRDEAAAPAKGVDAVRLRLRHAATGKVIFDTLPGESPLFASVTDLDAHEARGMAKVTVKHRDICQLAHFASALSEPQGVLFSGALTCGTGTQEFTLRVAAHPAQVGSAVAIDIRLGTGPANQVNLRAASTAEEQVLGGGEQFSRFNLKGQRLPIIASEQGVGRGKQPLTWLANLTNNGAGGSWHTTYAGVPHVLTSNLRSVFIDTHDYVVMNFTDARVLQFDVNGRELKSIWRQADTPLQLVEGHTEDAGRMRALPEWLDRGAIIGMQGGTQAVRAKLATLEQAGTPVAGFWLQDWVGQRLTSFGKQLWWNWTLDEQRYPGWDALRDDLARKNIRVLAYANTFLVDLDTKQRRSLIDEARQQGFLAKGADGQPLMSKNTSFSAAHIDLSNPAAYAWMKQVLKDEMLARGFSGWMADFAEGLPFEVQNHEGKPGGIALHNRWPELWAQLNRELIDEAAPDAVAFHRSGWSRSPRHATLFWLGDQLTDWGPDDGLASALTGLLTGGLSGFAINHSDIGGYTTLTSPVLSYTRSKELYLRWAEFAAFTPVFRTHEGNRPDDNWQFDSDAETLAHFTRMSTLFGCWRSTRRGLLREAQEHGRPVNRAMWLHYPGSDSATAVMPRQMLVGPDILVAPVLEPGASDVTANIPEPGWIHLWSGKAAAPGSARWPAPVGQPAVFVRAGSAAEAELAPCAARLDAPAPEQTPSRQR